LVVNGQVIRVALHDYSSRYVGIFTAISSMVAAILSWAVGALDWLSHSLVVQDQDVSMRGKFARCIKFFGPNKERILTAGAVSYLFIALLFLFFPSFDSWNFSSLLLIYILLGVGRSTYEGTLRAVFADFFPQEREGAFANIILSTGIASVVGFWLAGISPYALEIVTIVSSILAIVGFWKANELYKAEEQRLEPLSLSEDFSIS
jgi:MFS family permease